MITPVEEILLNEALDIANGIISSYSSDDNDLSDIENRLSQIKSALKALEVPANHLNGFQPIFNGNFQCPNCWVRSGIHARLTPIQGTDDEDIFRCGICDYEVTTPGT